MNFEKAFQVVDAAVFGQKQRHLKDIEVAILHGFWQDKKYHEIAQIYGYTVEYLKQDVGPKLWKLLSRILGEKISKTNFRAALARRSLLVQSSLTKTCPVQIFQDYGKSFRSEEQKSERSQLNLVGSIGCSMLMYKALQKSADGASSNSTTKFTRNRS